MLKIIIFTLNTQNVKECTVTSNICHPPQKKRTTTPYILMSQMSQEKNEIVIRLEIVSSSNLS